MWKIDIFTVRLNMPEHENTDINYRILWASA